MDTEMIAVEPLTEQIRKAVAAGKLSLPPLPRIVTQLKELLADEERVSSKQVATLIRNEPAIAASLLRMANSAAFGGLHPISDLTQAIARLGFKQVSSVVTALAHSSHFHSNDPAMKHWLEVLWGHAVATALGARAVANLTAGDPEEAFMAGLLHDTGKLLVLKAVDYIEKDRKLAVVTPGVLDELMDILHAELGHRTLMDWHLPAPICDVALRHHDKNLDLNDSLIIRVQVADAIARKIGEHPKPKPDLDLLEVPAVEQLSLTDIELATLTVDLEDEIAEVKQLV